jgi:predicted DNA-binding transcriptional regulator AlpA
MNLNSPPKNVSRDDAQHESDPHGLPHRLNVQEAARFLGLSVSTLNKMRMTGSGLPYIQLTRRRVAYRLCDLEAWVAQRKRNHTSE